MPVAVLTKLLVQGRDRVAVSVDGVAEREQFTLLGIEEEHQPHEGGQPAPVELGIQLQLLPGIDPWGDEPRFRPPNNDTDGGGR